MLTTNTFLYSIKHCFAQTFPFFPGSLVILLSESPELKTSCLYMLHIISYVCSVYTVHTYCMHCDRVCMLTLRIIINTSNQKWSFSRWDSQHWISSERNKVLIAWVTVCPRSVIWSHWLHPLVTHVLTSTEIITTIIVLLNITLCLHFSRLLPKLYYCAWFDHTEHHEQRIYSWENIKTD